MRFRGQTGPKAAPKGLNKFPLGSSWRSPWGWSSPGLPPHRGHRDAQDGSHEKRSREKQEASATSPVPPPTSLPLTQQELGRGTIDLRRLIGTAWGGGGIKNAFRAVWGPRRGPRGTPGTPRDGPRGLPKIHKKKSKIFERFLKNSKKFRFFLKF